MKCSISRLLAGLALSVLAAAPALAQDFPAKPITVIVPFPPGGSTDMVARAISQKAGAALGQQMVVDNRPGASGAIGATALKRSPPDGHTIMVASIAVYAVNPILQKNLAYDPNKDFDLLTVAVRAPNVLVVHPSMPVKNLKEFIDYLKKNPGKTSFASSGPGSSDHLTAALFWQSTGTSGLHVPYKGGAPAISDLLGGQVQSSFQNINAIVGHVKAGKLRALAVTGEKRSPALPDLPTLSEQGVSGADVYSWQAVAAPKGLPPAVKSKLHGAIVGALNDREVKPRLQEQGFEVVANTPEQFGTFMNQELSRWRAVVHRGGIEAN